MSRVRVAVLVSGSGTNLQAILDAAADSECPYEVAVVISNRRDAGGLERARRVGVEALWVPHRGKSRSAFDADLVTALEERNVHWVALAGFMRILTGVFLGAFPGRVINIHPALLPAFPGMHGQEQAFAYGVRIAGATVHFVDEGTDTGAIIAQAAVPVLQGEGQEELSARILKMEHRLYPMVLSWAAEGRLTQEGRKVVVDLPEGGQTLLWGD